ncbi:hypothetical protein G7Y79_00004g013550 [Physcia stellaris]|nr:hypothetical protein G7Y79_00004g013550 [Physcia stellaris]
MDTMSIPHDSKDTNVSEEIIVKSEPYDDDCIIVETTEHEDPIARLKRLKGFDQSRSKNIEPSDDEQAFDPKCDIDQSYDNDDYVPSSDHDSSSSSAARTPTPPLSCQAAVKRSHWPRQHHTPPPTPTPSRKRKAEDIMIPEGTPSSKLSKRAPRISVWQSRRSLTPLSGTRSKDQKLAVKRKRPTKTVIDECNEWLWEEPWISRRKKMKVTPILVEGESE